MMSALLEKIDLFNNKFSFLFPILLAILLFGQIFFSIIYHYLDISRPALLVAPVLAVLLLARFFKDGKEFRPTWIDICMGAFFAFILISLIMHGQYSHQLFFKNYIGFMAFPFMAGRLLNKNELKAFVFTVLFLTIAAAIIVSFELIFIPADEYNQDRISTLFWNYDPNYYGGIPTNTFAGFALAPLLILLHCPIFKIRDSKFFWMKATLIFLCVWVLLIIATRSTILSGLLFSAVAIVFFNYNNIKVLLRQAVLLISAILFALVMMPQVRTDFLLSGYNQLVNVVKKQDEYDLGDIEKVKPAAVPAQEEIPRSGVPKLNTFLPDINCTSNCNSISARYYLSLSALKIFEENPVFGIGANNYVVYTGESSQRLLPHNLTLHIFLELGVVGGGLYLFVVCGLIFYFSRGFVHKQRNQENNIIDTAFLLWGSILIIEQFSGNYFVTYQFYAMTGILISAYQRALMNKQEILQNA
ncbi:MAG: O-antigen ligase family protein [Pseudomonadota bacterium]